MTVPQNDPPNPYRAPAPAVSHIKLSRHERKVIDFWWRNRERPPGLLGMALRCVPSWCVQGLICLGGVLAVRFLTGGTRNADLLSGGLLLGLFVGTVSRDVSYLRQMIRIWPLYKEVLDWEKIAARVDQT